MRSKVSTVLMASAFLVVVMGSVFAGGVVTARSAVGSWKLNAQKSSYGNMPAPKFELLVITADNPDALKWRLTGASSDGKTYTSAYDGPIDGKDHSMMSNEAASTVAYSRTATGMQWTTKDKSGAVVETASSQISPDGNTLTIKGTTTGPKGKANFISVFERAP